MAEASDGTQAGRPLTWQQLPASAREAAIAAAGRALGQVPVARLSAMVRPLVRFTPRKRAQRGAVPLGKALASDAGFRALVAEQLPLDFAAPRKGSQPADPGTHARAAARAFLLQIPDSDEILAAAADADERAELRDRVATLTASVESLTGRVADLVAERDAAMERLTDAASTSEREADRAEIGKLKQRLRQQGTRVKDSEELARSARSASEAAQRRAAEEVASAESEAAKWRDVAEQQQRSAERARAAVVAAREKAGQAAADADRRIALLLDTLIRAATGLEREWRLTTGGVDPADAVASGLSAVRPPPEQRVDGAVLLEWLGLPGAHLIIDGYNVTKAGYGALPLADQRDRLVRALAPLAARTGVEVTVVFDGADVIGPAASTRYVRVIFSPANVIADDVIRQLVAAEPDGRVVVVVTSDREVVHSVRAAGARSAPSDLLLTLLSPS